MEKNLNFLVILHTFLTIVILVISTKKYLQIFKNNVLYDATLLRIQSKNPSTLV